VIAALLATIVAASAAASSMPPACSAITEFHQLDFWLGTWDVYSGKNRDGRDDVHAILYHCAIIEEWRDVTGHRGQSLFYFDSFAKQWQQIWITDQATYRGGLKRKTLVAVYPNGGVRFEGALPGAPGSATILDRTTLTPLSGGRVHQVIEISRDGGTTWKPTYDAIYIRIK